MKFVILMFFANEVFSLIIPFSNNIIMNDTQIIIPLVNETNQNLFFLTGNLSKVNAHHGYWLLYKYNDTFEGTKDYMGCDYEYIFKYMDIILAGDKLQYYLFYQFVEGHQWHRICCINSFNDTSDHVCITQHNLIGTLKKLNSYYYFINVNNEIIRMEISFNFTEREDMFKLNIEQFYEDDKILNSVSCDICKNNECYICSYFIDNKYYGISSYSNEFKLLYKKQYDSGTINPTNYFNKIVYFKDNITFITIHSIYKDIIRLRYFESNKTTLNNKLNIKNINSDYLDIINTQINPLHDSNDIAVLGNDTIIKVFCDENKIIISIIHFNIDESILTVKTFNSLLSVHKPRLIIWENKIVLSLIFEEVEYDYYNASGFFIFGNITPKNKEKTIKKNINNNNNININLFINEEDDLIFSYSFDMCKTLSIPKDFVFIDLIGKTELINGNYIKTQNNEIVFKKYKKNTNVILSFQVMIVGDFKNNTFQIFPSNAKISKEDKIIQEEIKIELDINIHTCDNDFYEIEDEYGICTNTRPDGYYLDLNNKMYKKCYNICSECFSSSDDESNMKCLKCIKGYKYDPKTFNCIKKDKEKDEDEEMGSETNIYFWVFIVNIILSFVIIFIAILILCVSKKKNNDKIEYNNINLLSKNEKKNTLNNNNEMGTIN